MFYYISFLRPPPLQASAADPVLITPQISNDLRTEFLDDQLDVYYVWSLHAPRTASTSEVTTKPAKLTSWRPSTAYKEIPVPRPPDQPFESSWRLILSCGTAPNDQVVLLGETDTTGRTPFAVASMPVNFTAQRRLARGGKNATTTKFKQERIARSYALRVPNRDRPIVFDITEQTSFDLDKKIWDSGIGLSSWLVHVFTNEKAATPLLRDSLFSTDARHIVELGAGTGIVAVTLAILRSMSQPHSPDNDKRSTSFGSIVATDLPSAIPILQENITANQSLMSICVPEAVVLDWEQHHLPEQVQDQLDAGLDVIIMADVAYNTASFTALIGTLAQLIRSSKRSPTVLMGYKERHPDERSLWDRAEEIGLHFRQVARAQGASGNPVEIWLGSMVSVVRDANG